MRKLILLLSLISTLPICAQNNDWYYILDITLDMHEMVHEEELFITRTASRCIVREEDMKYWKPDSSSVLSFFSSTDNNLFHDVPCFYFTIDSYTRACCLFGDSGLHDQLGDIYDCEDTLFLPDLFRMHLSFSDKSGSNLDIHVLKVQAEVCDCPVHNSICVTDNNRRSLLVIKDIHEIYPSNLLKTEFENTDVFDIIHSNFINVNISEGAVRNCTRNW